MPDGVCLDSSVLVKLLTPESLSGAAAALVSPGTEVFAPAFAWAEVGSALIWKVRSGRLSVAEADAAWDAFLRLRVVFMQDDNVARRAWEMARALELPTLYDAAFFAVAELAPGGPHPFYTADARLIEALAGRHPLAHPLTAAADSLPGPGPSGHAGRPGVTG